MSVYTDSLSTESTGLSKKTSRYQTKPGEAYMSSAQKTHLKKILKTDRAYWVDRQQKIISELLHTKTEYASSDAADIANHEVELSHGLRGREGRLIKKIDEALTRLETEGSHYGFCDICNNQIGIQRLEVRPIANLCVDCKTLDEIHRKQSGTH